MSTEPPSTGPDRVGLVAKQPGGLRSRVAICVADRGDSVTIVSKKEDLADVERRTFDSWETLEAPGPEMRSAAGRLMRADIARQQGTLKGRWSDGVVSAAAWEAATVDIAGSRGAIVDFVRLGLDGYVDGLGLSPSEVAWCRAVLASEDCDVVTMLNRLECLPSSGYPERAQLLLGTATTWLRDPQLRVRVGGLARAFQDTGPGINAIRAATDGTSGSASVRAARALLPALQAASSAHYDDLARLVAAAERGEMTKAPPGLPMPRTTALGIYLRGTNGQNVDRYAAMIGPLGMAQLDDLVDAGTLTRAGLDALPLTGEAATYVRCRIDPARVPIADVHAIGFAAEYARRLFRIGDGDRLSRFPRGFPDADHYRALLDLKNSLGVGPRDTLRPATRAVFETIDEYKDQLRADPTRRPPPAVLDDPTTWWLLRGEAAAGLLRPEPELRLTHPRFMTWLELCDLQRLVFEADWPAVRERGRTLAQKLQEEKLRDEALNLTAFASFVLGDVDGAMALLGEALEGSYTEALVVNASIVAAEYGSERAAQFLGKVFDEAPDEEVRNRALLRSVEIWLKDPNSPTLPAPTARCMRAALVGGMSDDATFQTLVKLASVHDRDWLAGAPEVRTSTPVQVDALLLYSTSAKCAAGQVPLDAFAAEIVQLNKLPVPHDWATQELSTMTQELMRAVHVPFGEGWAFLPAIRVLAEGGVLPLLEDTVLRVQGTMHVVVYLQEKYGNTIAPEIEQRHLFEPFERFKVEESALPPETALLVRGELDRCITVAAISMVLVSQAEITTFASAWDNLVARERWDHQNRPQILRTERELLDNVSRLVERTGRYLDRMERLPVDEAGQTLLVDMRGNVRDWTALLTRLRSML